MNLKEYKKILKNKNNQLLAIILIIGAVLIFASGTGNDGGDVSGNEEQRLEHILSDIKGAGDVSVMITYYENDRNTSGEKNRAKGAVVTASGCENPATKTAISDAVCAALDLPAHKVCVYLKR